MATKRSPAKKSKKPAPTPPPTPPPSAHYEIEVTVDKKGNFAYKANGNDARSLHPNLGDTISWSVRVNGKRKPFQIEFPGFSPFGFLNRVIRSASKTTKPLTVTLPKNYRGNLVMDYRVTVPGAWSDDPDIVPPSSDGVNPAVKTPQVVSLGIDPATGDLTLTPLDASFAVGAVTWQWSGTPQDDFNLTFDPPPPHGWPKNTTTSANGLMVLAFPTTGAQGYTVTTVHSNLEKHGTLIIA